MGALPHANGTAFLVWAPHAQQMLAKDGFNDWDDTPEQEGNGYGYVYVLGRTPGQAGRMYQLAQSPASWA